MIVLVSDRQKDLPLKHEHERIKRLVTCVIQHEKRPCDEVAVHLIGAPLMCRMHQRFFHDPSLTDCISFPIDNEVLAGFCYLGDIFVCPNQAILYASEHKLDPYRETTLYIIHGLLHLLGYDDRDAKDRKVMKKMEQKYLLLAEKLDLILCKK